jgi:rod shape determining protein RodA
MGLAGLLPVALVAMQVISYQQYLGELDAYEEAVQASEAYPGPEPTPFDDRSFPLGVKLKSYQLERVLTFLDPERDPADKGYQAIQMRITVGSGQLGGKGFAQGTQTHLSFLPEYHTDLIFALLAEEWGFTGAVTVLALLLAFLLRGTAVAGMCAEPSGTLVAAGCVAVLAFHALVNIAITVGLLPITGMPLPFLSYGGSFCITTLLCVGSIMGVYVRRRQFV